MARSTSLLWLLAAACTAFARERSRTEVINTVPGAYIVEFDDGHDAAQFRLQAEPEYKTRIELSYDLFKGVSIQLNVETAEDKAAQLASLPAVKNIWPLQLIPRPKLDARKASKDTGSKTTKRQTRKRNPNICKRQIRRVPDANSPHVMTQIDKLHAEGITGKGIKIAVIDTGIDYLHHALGGCFGEGCLVSYGTDFVGDDYNGSNNPTPDDDPRDTCDGHGTHVAGIIAAQENELGFTGAAPDATLAAYRVFGCRGYVGSDILIAAFNKAYEDGVDIISSSIGALSGWSQDPWAVAVSRIVEKGVPCILSAGNDGQPFDVSAASSGKGVAAVASFDNTMVPWELDTAFYTVNNSSPIPHPYAWGFPEWHDEEERILWVTGYDLNNTNDACEPLPGDTPDLSDFNVLIRRGDCDYSTQAQHVADKGGRFFTAYNNEAGTELVDVEFDAYGIEGAVMVPQDVGETWVKALKAGSTVKTRMVYWQNAEPFFINKPNRYTPGAVSDFSSWGPTFEMHAKPQFGAPGGFILSTYLSDGYSVASGTSMAAPLVAASYALVAEARGTFNPAEIENLLAANANPQLLQKFDSGSWGFEDWLAPPAQQGAGLVQVYDAVHATTLLEPSSLSFNDTDHFTETLTFTLTNTAEGDIAYEISHIPTNTIFILNGGSFDWSFPPANTVVHAELAFSQSKVIIKSGEAVTIEVTATPPRLDPSRYPLWSGYIAVNGSDGTSLSLSYQGLTGSLYDALPISSGDSWFSNSTISNNWDDWPVADGTIFTLPTPGTDLAIWEGDLPLVRILTTWGTPFLSADVVSLTSCPLNSTTNSTRARNSTGTCSGHSLGQAAGYPQRWMGRAFWSWLWGGALDSGEYVPPGRYKIVVKALRIFGDESKDEDWLVAETRSIILRYEKT